MSNTSKDNKSSNTINVQAVYTNTRKFVVKKAYTISFVRPNSPAARVGLQKGDVILKINGNDTIKYTLQELIYKFYDKEGKRITMQVDRFGKRIKDNFSLEVLIN